MTDPNVLHLNVRPLQRRSLLKRQLKHHLSHHWLILRALQLKSKRKTHVIISQLFCKSINEVLFALQHCNQFVHNRSRNAKNWIKRRFGISIWHEYDLICCLIWLCVKLLFNSYQAIGVYSKRVILKVNITVWMLNSNH